MSSFQKNSEKRWLVKQHRESYYLKAIDDLIEGSSTPEYVHERYKKLKFANESQKVDKVRNTMRILNITIRDLELFKGLSEYIINKTYPSNPHTKDMRTMAMTLIREVFFSRKDLADVAKEIDCPKKKAKELELLGLRLLKNEISHYLKSIK